MWFFKKDKKNFQGFIKEKAKELGLLHCPKCGKEDVLFALTEKCLNCEKLTPELDKKLTLLYAVEIINEFTEKHDEKNPNDKIKFVFDLFDIFIKKLKNGEMPKPNEIEKLRSLFENGNMGGMNFGGFVDLEKGKPVVHILKDLPNEEYVMTSLSAVALSISYINKLRTDSGKDLIISKRLADLNEGINSSDPKDSLSCLGLLINTMWTEDPVEQAEAIKLVASVLNHSNIDMVRKAASGLNERGPIGFKYLELTLADQQLSDAARVIIMPYAKMSAEPHIRQDITWKDIKKQAGDVISMALKECEYHGFSSTYVGLFPKRESNTLRYVFDISSSSPYEHKAILSFQYQKSEIKVHDEDCIPAVKAFVNKRDYKEILNIPSKSRYFSWSLV